MRHRGEEQSDWSRVDQEERHGDISEDDSEKSIEYWSKKIILNQAARNKESIVDWSK